MPCALRLYSAFQVAGVLVDASALPAALPDRTKQRRVALLLALISHCLGVEQRREAALHEWGELFSEATGDRSGFFPGDREHDWTTCRAG